MGRNAKVAGRGSLLARAASIAGRRESLLVVDLADLYRATGRETDAERILRDAIFRSPDAAAARHALGLGLIRQKRYDEAVEQLELAAEYAADEPRYAYVACVAFLLMRGSARLASQSA